MPQSSLRNSLIVYGRIRPACETGWDPLSRGQLLVVPDSKCHLLSAFSDLPGPGDILYTSAYTPAPTTRRPGLLLWSKSAPHQAVFTAIHDRSRNSGKRLRSSMA